MVGIHKIDTSMAFGRVLRSLRKQAGLTQEQLGFEADLRRTYVSTLELGQQQPSLETVLKLALALRVSPGEMVEQVAALIAHPGEDD